MHWQPDGPTPGVPSAGDLRRRSFLKLLVGNSVWLAAGSRLASAVGGFQVGVGSSADPYAATERAVSACEQWPAASIAGQTVVIKPNLVGPAPAPTGITTDPQVVRALVDLALAAGAVQVIVIEGGVGQPKPAPFGVCGYSFFNSYDPRVQLIDLANQPVTLANVPGGFAYRALYLPTLVLDPSVVFISVGKLKTHINSGASLTMKNLFGLAAPVNYSVPNQILPRVNLHYRGVDLSIVDLNLARPVHFGVIDGIWAMQGNGPFNGTPVQMNLVLAGVNPVAVDRVGVQAMGIPQNAIQHLAYAASRGMGPWNSSAVTLLGDSFTPAAFVPAQTAPLLWRPVPFPATISLSAGQQTTLYYNVPVGCQTRVEIIQDSDVTPGITLVRTLHDWTPRPAGTEAVAWNGLDDNGAPVSPGVYLARAQARYSANAALNYATNFVTVTA